MVTLDNLIIYLSKYFPSKKGEGLKNNSSPKKKKVLFFNNKKEESDPGAKAFYETFDKYRKKVSPGL